MDLPPWVPVLLTQQGVPFVHSLELHILDRNPEPFRSFDRDESTPMPWSGNGKSWD